MENIRNRFINLIRARPIILIVALVVVSFFVIIKIILYSVQSTVVQQAQNLGDLAQLQAQRLGELAQDQLENFDYLKKIKDLIFRKSKK